MCYPQGFSHVSGSVSLLASGLLGSRSVLAQGHPTPKAPWPRCKRSALEPSLCHHLESEPWQGCPVLIELSRVFWLMHMAHGCVEAPGVCSLPVSCSWWFLKLGRWSRGQEIPESLPWLDKISCPSSPGAHSLPPDMSGCCHRDTWSVLDAVCEYNLEFVHCS